MMIAQRHWPFAAVAAVAIVLGVLFLQEPKLGDDFTYWRLAFELNDHVGGAWSVKSFHALRWPVWGVSWVALKIVGPGLISFYAVPLFYLALGAMLAFGIARYVIGTEVAGWCAAIAFIFSPLIDSVVYRPMPDLSEGVVGAAIVCVWLALMQSAGTERWGRSVILAALGGLLLALIYANRFTGLLTIPLIGVLTLLFFPRRFAWLFLILAFAAAFVAIECAVYHSMTGDWLHSLHANMSARGKKGTESIALWKLPIRFIDSLFKGNRLSMPFMLATIGGALVVCRRHGHTGRIVAAWSVVLYLGYSCAIQSINPIRPMLRDADRFLGSLSIPFSILIAGALTALPDLLRKHFSSPSSSWFARFLASCGKHPSLTGTASVAVLLLATSREWFERGYIPPFRAYLASRGDRTHVFTHRPMRAFAYLMSARDARRLSWFSRAQIIEQNDELERAAEDADEFWYIRKLAWMRQRKDLLVDDKTSPKILGSYFDRPHERWKLNEVLLAADTPEFIFYRKRAPTEPSARVLAASDLRDLIPSFPLAWDGSSRTKLERPVPSLLQGQLVQIQMISSANIVQPFLIKADFLNSAGRLLDRIELKPHVYSTAAKDFYAVRVPSDAILCRFDITAESGLKRFEMTDMRLVLD